jgi:peptide/nickel transport system permease protein
MGLTAVQWGSGAATTVISEAGLAFVGLGPKDGVSLGALLDQGVASMLFAPHTLVLSTVAVFATSLSLLLSGRAIRW